MADRKQSNASTADRQPGRGMARLQRFAQARVRLLASIGVGLVLIFVLPAHLRLTTKLLIGWDVGVGLYLLLALQVFASADIDRIRRHAAIEDEGRGAILVLTAAAALASLGAIVAELGAVADASRSSRELSLAVVTILLSWFFTHTIFAVHYAHDFYGDHRGKASGLAFPGKDQPDYWDFVYFSFVIGMTAQVSDVAVTSKMIRRTVTAHGIVSFLFNAALLALTVNIAANAI